MQHRLAHALRLFVAAALFVTWAAFPAHAGEEYPLRPYYPEVPFLSTESLLNTYDSIIVVDIRSSFEYDVAHINKAILLPLSDPQFAKKLEEIRHKASPTPMAFYCNGHSCAKSYQAAQLAISLGFSNVYVYDGGIFDWIMAAPDKATLMRETPARVDRIISNDEFGTRLIDYDTFSKMAMDEDTIVIDIRDPFQREMLPRIPGIRNIPLDPLLDLVISRIWTEKQLLFFDAVGKQVRWLQYFLESYGYFNYGFLDKGVRALGNDPGRVTPVITADRSIISNQESLLKITTDKRLSNADRKVLNYLVANVKFNNYIVVDIVKGLETLGMGRSMLVTAMEKLSRYDYLRFSIKQSSLIAQIDPNIAWKGRIGSKTWKEAANEFKHGNRK